MTTMKSSSIAINSLVSRTLKLGMDSGTFLQINYRYGFEQDSCCYETWCGVWEVSDPVNKDFRFSRKGQHPIRTVGKTIEVAIQRWAQAVEANRVLKAEYEKASLGASTTDCKE